MSSSLRAFLAAACGALIGSLVGLELGRYLMFVGMIIGGLVGYIGYAPKRAFDAICQACSEIFCKEKMEHLGIMALTLVIMLAILGLAATYIFSVVLPFAVLESWFRGVPISWEESGPGYAGGWSPGLLLIYAVYVGISTGVMVNTKSWPISLPWDACSRFMESEFIEDSSLWFRGTILFLLFNPVGVCIIVVPGLFVLVTIAWLVIGVAAAGQLFSACIKVLPRAIVLMHEEARLVAGAAAALGSAVGFFAGSALVGGLVGGVLGLADVAFLRKRVLAWGAAQRTTTA